MVWSDLGYVAGVAIAGATVWIGCRVVDFLVALLSALLGRPSKR
jgi:hypothetical protein